MTIGREAYGCINIPSQKPIRTAKDRHCKEILKATGFFARAYKINGTAIGRERQTPEIGFLRRQNLDVATTRNLPQPQPRSLAVALCVNDVVAVGGNGGILSLAATRKLGESQVPETCARRSGRPTPQAIADDSRNHYERQTGRSHFSPRPPGVRYPGT